MVNAEMLAAAGADLIVLAGGRTHPYNDGVICGRKFIYGEYELLFGHLVGVTRLHGFLIYKSKQIIAITGDRADDLPDPTEDFEFLALIADRSNPTWSASYTHLLEIAAVLQ